MDQLGNAEEEYHHAQKLNCGDERVFSDSAVPDVVLFQDLVYQVHDQANCNPSDQESQEQTDRESCISDEISIQCRQLERYRCLSFFILTGYSVLEVIGPEVHVHPGPSVVILGEGVSY